MVVVLFGTSFTSMPVKAETTDQNAKVYQGEGYDVTFKIDSQWGEAFNATVTLKNTGTTKIEDWCLGFNLNNSITNIWNAKTVSNENGYYTIKNAGYNQDVEVGSSVSFGFTAQGTFTGFPDLYNLIGQVVQVNAEDCKVAYSIESDWGAGFNGKVTLTNNTNETIDDWNMEFDFDNEISNIWNAVITKHEGNHYVIGNVTHNQNIAAGQSISFGFTVNQGTSANFIKNEVLNKIVQEEIQTDEDLVASRFDSGAIIVAEGSDIDKSIHLTWDSNYSFTEYTVYLSKDGRTYTELAKTAEKEYPYPYESGYTGKLYFKISSKLKEDSKITESNCVTMAFGNEGYTMSIVDPDNDGVADYIEELYGTDNKASDSDGDLLSDYHEIYILGTDPLLPDSDWNGVSDADEDIDGDGLSNYSEIYTYKTDPKSKDSDSDSISDYDEVKGTKGYTTDPLNSDSDYDYLSDAAEYEVGTIPTDEDSDDDGILDGKENYNVKIHPDTEDKLKFSLEASIKGNQVDTLNVSPVDKENPYINDTIPGYLGNAYDLYVDGTFTSAKISFDISSLGEEITKAEGFVPAIYYFNEDTHVLEYVEGQVWEGNVISAELSHFSSYILLNKTAFDKVWSAEIKSPDDVSSNKSVDIVLAIDSSGSMSSSDYDDLRLSAAKMFVDRLGTNDRAAIIDFDSYVESCLGFTNDKKTLYQAIERIDSYGGTDLSDPISTAISLFTSSSYNSQNRSKYIVLLTDGQGSYSTTYTTKAANNKIVIYTIGLGSSVDANLLKSIANGTQGKYYFASKADDLAGVYDDVAGETIDYVTDSNSDGISDYYTKLMCDGTLRTTSGSLVFKNADYNTVQQSNDYDGDDIKSGDEITITPMTYYSAKYPKAVSVSLKSSPASKDTDGDEIEDCYDKEPNKAWDYKKSNLGRTVYDAGFRYYPTDDIIYSRKNAEQNKLGFCYAYDEGIVAISSILDCETIYFQYGGKEWMAELWKGQYGIETGGEIGLYYRDENDYRFGEYLNKNAGSIANILRKELNTIFGGNIPGFVEDKIEELVKSTSSKEAIASLDSMVNWLRGDSLAAKALRKVSASKVKTAVNVLVATRQSLTSKVYKAVNPSDYLKMHFSLSSLKNSFTRDSLGHWWLTGFEWGVFTNYPSDITMYNTITFKNAQMQEAFLNGKSLSDNYDYSGFTKYDVLYTRGKQNDGDANNDNNNVYGLYELGYESDAVSVNNNSVTFKFKNPYSVQPISRAILSSSIQKTNKRNVDLYNSMKKVCSISSNDPNKIYNTIYKYAYDGDMITSDVYNRFYQEFGPEFEKYFDGFWPWEGKKFGSTYDKSYDKYVCTFLRDKLELFTGNIDQVVRSAFIVAGGALRD